MLPVEVHLTRMLIVGINFGSSQTFVDQTPSGKWLHQVFAIISIAKDPDAAGV